MPAPFSVCLFCFVANVAVLRFQSARTSEQEGYVLDARQVEQLDERARYAQAEAAVCGAP